MTILASTTALLIASSKRSKPIGVSSKGLETWAITFADMHAILLTLLAQQLGPKTRAAEQELESLASSNGWLNAAGTWRVPEETMTPPSRARKGAR